MQTQSLSDVVLGIQENCDISDSEIIESLCEFLATKGFSAEYLAHISKSIEAESKE
jgi:hypothetical protein